MIKEVIMYQTSDGKVFQSEQQASRHCDDILCNKLEAMIDHIFPNVGHRPSVIKAVQTLADDKQVTIGMLQELLYVLTYGDSDT